MALLHRQHQYKKFGFSLHDGLEVADVFDLYVFKANFGLDATYGIVNLKNP